MQVKQISTTNVKELKINKRLQLVYAGGSATAIAKINEDAEKRKKEVANRNKACKQNKLF
jgi:malic enzyme